MEETVNIPGKGVNLEGRFILGTTPGGVVITHPHPLYGGSMDNNVVWTARKAFEAHRWSTLRFNFRGVGRSSGSYGQGLAEVDDVAAALAFLKEKAPGPHFVIGYSFGAAVAARAMLAGLEADGVLLISPPIAFMEMDFLPRVPRLELIVVGDRDELCPLTDLHTCLSAKQPAVEIAVITGADHFFGGREDQLFQILRDYPLTAHAQDN
jgi:alpha/beta superfamily hydrolase